MRHHGRNALRAFQLHPTMGILDSIGLKGTNDPASVVRDNLITKSPKETVRSFIAVGVEFWQCSLVDLGELTGPKIHFSSIPCVGGMNFRRLPLQNTFLTAKLPETLRKLIFVGKNQVAGENA